jgi:nitrite reductase/ring-hydroxylating ferredoxin subunit
MTTHPQAGDGRALYQHMECASDGTEIIVVELAAGGIRRFRNLCPHRGVGLDYGDGRCLDGDGRLVCALHGAVFDPDTGICRDGPCRGDALDRVDEGPR